MAPGPGARRRSSAAAASSKWEGCKPIVVFVEVFRLLVVVLGAVGGLQVGEHVHHTGWAPLAGVFLGAGITYVAGGVVGRVVDHGIADALDRLRRVPATEVLAAAVVGTGGLLLGTVASVPVLALVHSPLVLPVAGAVTWILCALGVRLGAAKGRDVARAAGIAHLLDPRMDRPVGASVVVDTSGVLDRTMAAVGRAGLLTQGLSVPRFVMDEVRQLADSPDPATSRRARRGLEALAALREAGVTVAVLADDPVVASAGDRATAARVVAVAQRIGGRVLTASSAVVAAASEAGVAVVDLRALTGELLPDHPVGERLTVDLVRPGRLPQQAVGYLPDGDMVVVNDAADLVGANNVPVTVAGSRRTTQGQLLFARLADRAG